MPALCNFFILPPRPPRPRPRLSQLFADVTHRHGGTLSIRMEHQLRKANMDTYIDIYLSSPCALHWKQRKMSMTQKKFACWLPKYFVVIIMIAITTTTTSRIVIIIIICNIVWQYKLYNLFIYLFVYTGQNNNSHTNNVYTIYIWYIVYKLWYLICDNDDNNNRY